MNSMDEAFNVLREAFQRYKIEGLFGIDDNTLKTKIDTLLSLCVGLNIREVNLSLQYLFDLAKIDQDAFLTSFLFILNEKLTEKINRNDITKNKLKNLCDNNEYSFDEYIGLVKRVYELKNGFSIGDSLPEEIVITEKDALYYFDIITELVQSCEGRLQSVDNKQNITNLYIAFNCTKKMQMNPYYFYKLADLVTELMNHTGDYQLARNTAEQIFQLSIKNNCGIFGIYIKANCYLMQKNIVDSLIYLSVVVNCIDESATFDFWKNLLTRIQILYRELRAEELENNLYLNLKTYESFFDKRTKDQIYLSHFATAFSNGKNVSQDVYKYISSNREEIYSIGIDGFKVWYCLLQQLYQHFSDPDLIIYINEFKKYLPKDVLDIINKSIGIVENDINVINEIISQIKESKYNQDRNSEIKRSAITLHSLLDKAFNTKDINLFLNTSRLLSGVNFISPEDGSDGPVEIKFTIEVIEDDFNIFLKKFQNNSFLKQFDVMVIEKSEKNIYILFISEERHLLIKSTSRYIDFIKYVDSLPAIMFFDENDDVQTQTNKLMEQIVASDIMDFNIATEKPYILISDVDLCLLPSNLIINNHTFLSCTTKSLSMPSLDYLINIKEKTIKNEISLWCPLDNGDMPMNYAFQGVQSYLEDYLIPYETKMIPEKVLFTDISVIIAHGGKDISHKQYFMAGGAFGNADTFYTDITKIIPYPKLVILFICHSGKAEKNLLYETSQSMQDLLFEKGAYAIISPKWPLNTEIPGLWLPKFLNSMKSGKTSFEAFSEAQNFVMSKHPNAGAWACLHYFGNPNIKLEEKESN